MLFLILFSILSIGFYASTTMSVQVARNERVAADAQYAAESGLAFMRYQLEAVDFPTSTTNANLLTACADRARAAAEQHHEHGRQDRPDHVRGDQRPGRRRLGPARRRREAEGSGPSSPSPARS
jgi:Tfp pilus assembly protein PilX